MSEQPGFERIQSWLDGSRMKVNASENSGERQVPDVCVRRRAFQITVADLVYE
jgi:hypothetical protein